MTYLRSLNPHGKSTSVLFSKGLLKRRISVHEVLLNCHEHCDLMSMDRAHETHACISSLHLVMVRVIYSPYEYVTKQPDGSSQVFYANICGGLGFVKSCPSAMEGTNAMTARLTASEGCVVLGQQAPGMCVC